MKKLLFSIAALLCVSAAWADDGYTVSNIEIPQNGSVVLEVGLNNTDNQCAGFQFELYLPEGIVVHQVESEYVFTEGSRMSGKGFTTAISYVSGHYQILSYKTPPTAINGISGTIISIPLEVTGSFTVAQELNASLKVCKITNLGGDSFTLNAEIPFTITIGEPVDGRTVLDEESTTAPASATGVDVRVKRTIAPGVWNTICLPFAMSEAQVKAAFGDDVKLGNFTGWTPKYDENDDDIVTGVEVLFEEVNAIQKNHPYIIKRPSATTALTEFTVDGVEISPISEPTVTVGKTNKGTFGSFTGTYVAGTTIDEECLFLNDNKFWYSVGNTTTNAFRAYFYFQEVLTSYGGGASARMRISFNEEVTEVKDVKQVGAKDGRIYNMQGQQVEQPGKGLYIKDGKVFMNK